MNLVLCTLIPVCLLHIPTVHSCSTGQSVKGIDQTPHNKEVNPGEDATIVCKIGEQYNVSRIYVEKNCQMVTANIEMKITGHDLTVIIKNVTEDGAYFCLAVLQNQTEISGGGTYLHLSQAGSSYFWIIAFAVAVIIIGIAGVFCTHTHRQRRIRQGGRNQGCL